MKTLKDKRKNCAIAGELHFARLCHLPVILRTTEVKHVCDLAHRAVYIEKPRSLMKKKVSFSVKTEDKCHQVEICPHHGHKNPLKTSTHQFPPVEEQPQNNPPCKQVQTTDDFLHPYTNDNDSCFKQIDNDICFKQTGNVINVDLNKNSEGSESSFYSKSSDPYVLDKPQINVYYDQFGDSISQIVVKNILNSTDVNLGNPKEEQKIVVFREMTNIQDVLVNNGEEDKNYAIKSKEDKIIQQFVPNNCDGNVEDKTIMLLKSLYALVYILMFTALNLEYTCVYNWAVVHIIPQNKLQVKYILF